MNDSVSCVESIGQEQESAQYSSFDDAACGEPLTAQHVVLDFTPIEEDPTIMYRNAKTNTSLDTTVPVPSAASTDLKRTAVSMLEIVEGKGLINRIFETKLPQSQCTLGSREYRENEVNLPNKAISPKQDTVCTCTGSCKMCAQRQGYQGSTLSSLPAVVDLCSKMDVWDVDHPKSMDPPGHPPLLTHCAMQRYEP